MCRFPQTSKQPSPAHLLSSSLSETSPQAQHLPALGAQECRLAHVPDQGPCPQPTLAGQ